VGWALQDLEKLRESGVITEDVAISVLPLGTGNDMARTLGCGGGYHGEAMLQVLRNCAMGDIQKLDRWKVKIAAVGVDGTEEKEIFMCNYFSIGWDAQVARRFHCLREKKPHLFKNRHTNKGWYAYFSIAHLTGNFDCSKGGMSLEVDGKEKKIPKGCVSFNILNIPSYSGGTNLWGLSAQPGFTPQKTDDGKLEVVGYSGAIHMLGIRGGFRKSFRIAQGSNIVVKTKAQSAGGPNPARGICCQVDGEPYVVDHKGFHEDASYELTPGAPASANIDLTVTITHHAVSTLVMAPSGGGGCCVKPKMAD